MLSSQGSATIKDNSTEKCMDLPWFFFFLPAAISPTTSLQLLSIVINWKSELVCSMKPLPGAITLQLSVRNCHPPSRRSKPCSSSRQHAPPLQKARPGQTSAGYRTACCRLFLWRQVFWFITVITGTTGTIPFFCPLCQPASAFGLVSWKVQWRVGKCQYCHQQT